jgi:hypothetical protein
MFKPRVTKKEYNWSTHHIRSKGDFIGTVKAPDAETAIKKAIEEFNVPENQRNRLMAQRRD